MFDKACTFFTPFNTEKLMRAVPPPKRTHFTFIPTSFIFAKYLDDACFRVLCYFYTHLDEDIKMEKITTDLGWSKKELDKCLETLIEYKFIISD